MDKKKYLWMGIAIVAVVIIALVIVKLSDKSDTTMQNTPVSQEAPIINNEAEEQAKNNVPNEPSITDTMTLAAETMIEVNGKTFAPKTFTEKVGEKVFLTFAAKDEERHTFNFVDADLSFILVTFNKAEGNKSITFPAPAAGTYTFFVDDKENTGTMIVK